MSRTTPAKSGKESRIRFGQKRERKITTTTTTTKTGGGGSTFYLYEFHDYALTFLAPSNFAVFLLPIFPLLLPIAKN